MNEMTTDNHSPWDPLKKDMSKEGIKLSFRANREYTLSKDQYTATTNDNFWALAIAIRDRIVERWIKTQQRYHKENVKRVYYLSLEFLIGRLLGNYMYNLGLEKEIEQALKEMGIDLDEVREQELDAGLGSGGLGRLAACFLDSMATLGVPAIGYGIRYDYGIFHQKIKNGYQLELPDQWLRYGSPWEFARPEYKVKIRFYGRTESYRDEEGKERMRLVDTEEVFAVPYDMPIPGYKNDVVNTLRLWSARSTEDFDLDYFNSGNYEGAVQKKIYSENISKVLYPKDDMRKGQELRLKQEYFFTAAAIADIIRRYKVENTDLTKLADKIVIQLNDTHPSLAVVEMMRILIDDHAMDWDAAWEVTRKVFAYTNHTLMPEAMECWSVRLFEKLLPRHLQIIYEINARFIDEVRQKYPGDERKVRRISIIEEGDPKRVRMAHLATVGSFSVNGVSQLHTELLKKQTFKDFNQFFPSKINNKTNGITQRRWLLKANPALSDLITQSIDDEWIHNLSHLEQLIPLSEDASFREKWQAVKNNNKQYFARYIEETTGVVLDPSSMFDVQVKRIHEYKRQLMFTLYIISEYLKLKNDPTKFIQPKTFIIGGKAAPAYTTAKLIIKFINNVAGIINNDESIHNKLKLVFVENYRVSLAEKIFPASDLSEQISTAGTEASGTGNMKFMLNGALTIGTYDGANIEMTEQVGEDNIFIFGLRAADVKRLRRGGYHPLDHIEHSPILKEVLRLIDENFFSKNEEGIFLPLTQILRESDYFLVCADFDSYLKMHEIVDKEYQNRDSWNQTSIVNTAKSGYFSSDRTIREYAHDIWKIGCQ